LALSEHREWLEELTELGFTDVWSSETAETDAFTPLTLAATWAPALRLGTAIVSSFTRGPAILAQTIGTMCALAPGRFALGIGSSSSPIVQGWNGIPFDRPYERTRDVVQFLRRALTGEKVSETYETFSIDRFQLGVVPEEMPPILIAALRPRMLRLAGTDGDGVILNWLSAEDVQKVVPIVGEGKEVVARLFVIPSDDREHVQRIARRMITSYLTVPTYAKFQEWLGRGQSLAPVWNAWNAGDRKAAVEAVPDELIDELFVWGSPEQMRDHVSRYVANGVTTPIPMIIATGASLRPAIRALSPRPVTGTADKR
jgi:probable F420-dependent oxidoreductase